MSLRVSHLSQSEPEHLHQDFRPFLVKSAVIMAKYPHSTRVKLNQFTLHDLINFNLKTFRTIFLCVKIMDNTSGSLSAPKKGSLWTWNTKLLTDI